MRVLFYFIYLLLGGCLILFGVANLMTKDIIPDSRVDKHCAFLLPCAIVWRAVRVLSLSFEPFSNNIQQLTKCAACFIYLFIHLIYLTLFAFHFLTFNSRVVHILCHRPQRLCRSLERQLELKISAVLTNCQ